METIEKFYPTSQKVVVEDYPYGRLRTKATYGIEFKAGKGFRSTFQTVNPKTGRINNPKKSTYSHIVILYKEVETGYVKAYHTDINGAESINKTIKFMDANFTMFDQEQIEDICLTFAAAIKADMYAKIAYAGSKLEDIKGFYDNLIKAIVAATKVPNKNLFKAMQPLDYDGIKATAPEGYSPFR